MKNTRRKFLDLLKDEEGPSMVEYALMLVLIAIVCVAIVGQIGQHAFAAFTTADGAVNA